MPEEIELETEKYLVENPEYADYLRRANRRPWSLRRLLQKLKFLVFVAIFFFGVGAVLIHYQKEQGNYEGAGIQIYRALSAMIGELDQEKKIWETIDN